MLPSRYCGQLVYPQGLLEPPMIRRQCRSPERINQAHSTTAGARHTPRLCPEPESDLSDDWFGSAPCIGIRKDSDTGRFFSLQKNYGNRYNCIYFRNFFDFYSKSINSTKSIPDFWIMCFRVFGFKSLL
jgi:hypothetical protein